MLSESNRLVARPKDVALADFGIAVFESRHAAGFAPSTLEHEHGKFLLVIAGRARLQGSGCHFELQPDSLVHVAPHTRHHYEDTPNHPVTLYALYYRTDLLPAPVAQCLGHGLRHWNLGGSGLGLARPFRSDFQQMLYEQTSGRLGWQSVLVHLFGLIAVRAARLDLRRGPDPGSIVFPSGSDSIERVAQYLARLETDFFRQQSLDDASQSCGLSRRRFSDIVRKLTGNSWRQQLDRLRIQHAERLLQSTERSVVAIAFEAGFETATSFYRSFKRVHQVTPQSFRRHGADRDRNCDLHRDHEHHSSCPK